MKIYLLIRSGNEKEGPNGEDTSFLIAGKDHIQVAQLADSVLYREAVQKVCNYTHAIFELGKASFKADKPIILLGPIVQYFSIPNNCRQWVRYEREDEWYEVL